MIAELSDRFLRAASLIVTDRRWAATLSAAALGFGIFVGVAIGPGAAGTVASGAQQVVMPSLSGGTSEGEEGEGGGAKAALAGPAGNGGGGGEPIPPEPPLPVSEPYVPIEGEPALPASPPKEPTAEKPTATGEGPEEPEATELKGVVVHANPAAGSYALAIQGGELVSVHARKLPQPGSRLTVEAVQLANATFSEEDTPRSAGKAAQAKFRGTVTFVDPDPVTPAYTVSGRGASLLVQVSADPSGAVPPPPALGTRVAVDATIEQGGLRQLAIEVEAGEPSTYLDLSGIYGGLAADGKLLLSADGTRASEADLALMAGPKIEAAKLKPGDSYVATAEVAVDGSLTLVGIASDEQLKGAGDPKSAQGDLKR